MKMSAIRYSMLMPVMALSTLFGSSSDLQVLKSRINDMQQELSGFEAKLGALPYNSSEAQKLRAKINQYEEFIASGNAEIASRQRISGRQMATAPAQHPMTMEETIFVEQPVSDRPMTLNEQIQAGKKLRPVSQGSSRPMTLNEQIRQGKELRKTYPSTTIASPENEVEDVVIPSSALVNENEPVSDARTSLNEQIRGYKRNQLRPASERVINKPENNMQSSLEQKLANRRQVIAGERPEDQTADWED